MQPYQLRRRQNHLNPFTGRKSLASERTICIRAGCQKRVASEEDRMTSDSNGYPKGSMKLQQEHEEHQYIGPYRSTITLSLKLCPGSLQPSVPWLLAALVGAANDPHFAAATLLRLRHLHRRASCPPAGRPLGSHREAPGRTALPLQHLGARHGEGTPWVLNGATGSLHFAATPRFARAKIPHIFWHA